MTDVRVDTLKFLQTYLAGENLYTVTIDGKWGPKTHEAVTKGFNLSKPKVKDIQRALYHGGYYVGEIDGLPGRLTNNAIRRISGELQRPSKIAWGKKLNDPELNKVIAITDSLGMSVTEGPSQLTSCIAWESAETFSPSIRNAAGSGACVDTETEILTSVGWKRYNEVGVGTEVYTVNYEEGGVLELNDIQHMTIKSSSDNYRMTSRSFDSLSTHDHRWYLLQRYYCRADNTPDIKVKTTEEIVNLKSSHTYNVPHINRSYIDRIVVKRKEALGLYRLLGLIAGDGSISKERGRIELVCWLQNHREMKSIVDAIDQVFPEGVPTDTRKTGLDMIRWRFTKEQSSFLLEFFDVEYNKLLDTKRFIKKLNPEVFGQLDYLAAKELLKGYLDSDGHRCKSNNSISFRNTEKSVIDDFMFAAVLAGENPRMVSIEKREGGMHVFPNGREYPTKDIYTVYLRNSRYTSMAKHQLKTEKISDEITVWCPTVKNGNWIARRNGTVYVTGNCGLIQFMPSTALPMIYPASKIALMSAAEKKAYGLKATDVLAKMSVFEQLDYVHRYFLPYRNKLRNLSDLYMAILWPKAIGKPESHILWNSATSPTTFRQNAGLDINKDGAITKSEAAQKVYEKLIRGMTTTFAR